MTEQHHHDADNTPANLRVAFVLNLGFTLLEIVGGFWTNSVAILADAVHDLGDSLSLGLAWYLESYAERVADPDYSYGYRRFSMLGALINSIVLIAGSIWVLASAIPRLLAPESVQAGGMIVLALVGIGVNGLAVFRLRRNQSLNAQVVGWHLLEDVLGWIAVLIVSILLLFTDWTILDPILSILVTLFVLANVVRKLRRTGRLFLQGVPPNVNMKALEHRILDVEPIQAVHHMHLWSLDGEHHVFTAHVVLPADTSKAQASQVKRQLVDAINTDEMEHMTIEIEFGEDDCRLDIASG